MSIFSPQYFPNFPVFIFKVDSRKYSFKFWPAICKVYLSTQKCGLVRSVSRSAMKYAIKHHILYKLTTFCTFLIYCVDLYQNYLVLVFRRSDTYSLLLFYFYNWFTAVTNIKKLMEPSCLLFILIYLML